MGIDEILQRDINYMLLFLGDKAVLNILEGKVGERVNYQYDDDLYALMHATAVLYNTTFEDIHDMYLGLRNML